MLPLVAMVAGREFAVKCDHGVYHLHGLLCASLPGQRHRQRDRHLGLVAPLEGGFQGPALTRLERLAQGPFGRRIVAEHVFSLPGLVGPTKSTDVLEEFFVAGSWFDRSYQAHTFSAGAPRQRGIGTQIGHVSLVLLEQTLGEDRYV